MLRCVLRQPLRVWCDGAGVDGIVDIVECEPRWMVLGAPIVDFSMISTCV